MISPATMDALCSGGLLLLESTFILAALMLLHGSRRNIGIAPLMMVLGLLLLYAHFIAAAGIRYSVPSIGLDVTVASTAVMMPCLALFLILYIVDGTLLAQRVILGVIAVCVIFYYLQATGVMQSSWSGPSIVQDAPAGVFGSLMTESSRNLAAATVAMLFDALIMPMIYQRLRNFGCRILLCFVISMIAGQSVDILIYLSVRFWGEPQHLAAFPIAIIPRFVVAAWLSYLASIYIRRIPDEEFGSTRGTCDIVVAFFGSYGKAKSLEKDLNESMQRYRTLVQNAGDLILLVDSDGVVADANRSAVSFLQCTAVSDVIGKKLEALAGRPVDLKNKRASGLERLHLSGNNTDIEMKVTPVMLGGTPAYLLIGRDITERERLAREREEWRTELAHAQRLEAIGRLAGGIAHDFNNYIHSINGQLDLIYMGEVTDESMVHLQKIDAIAAQAGKLTSQLLGYARKGRRKTVNMPLGQLVRDTLELFLPDSRNMMVATSETEKKDLLIRCDPTQIQQALLNLLINARDAMLDIPEEERKLSVKAGTLPWLSVNPVKPADRKDLPSENTLCGIMVSDTGPGVDPAVIDKIFEPFFTTKPIGMGTGMGLSMAYGVAVEHGGWIQYKKNPSGGASFTILLPIAEKTEDPGVLSV